MNMNRYLFSLVLVFGVNFASTGPAAAFSEDICYAYKKQTSADGTEALIPMPFNCEDLQCSDGVDGDSSGPSCALSGFRTMVAADMLYQLHGRNGVHFDVIWLLGRAAGLSESDSNDLAGYDQATDLGQYREFDYTGSYLWETEHIDGVQRTNDETDGFWFHFVPWYRYPGDTAEQHELTYDENHPQGSSPFPDWEVPLNHVRSWAFGQRETLCSFGLTQSDGSCYPESEPAWIHFRLPMLGPVSVDRPTEVFRQKIMCLEEGKDSCSSYDPVSDARFSGTPKALGIFLHMMGDRLSHAVCTDYAAIEQNTDQGSVADYKLRYPFSCATGVHLTMHIRETGHSPVPERTQKAVWYSLYEIEDWIKTTGYQPKTSLSDTDKKKIVQRILDEAIPQSCAASRLEALCKISRDYGLGWHDNNPNCSYRALNCDQP